MSGCFLKGQGAEKENNNMSEGFEIIISVNGKEMTADIFKSESGEAFVQLLKDGPLTISMSDYGGFEKVCQLGKTLPREDQQITTEAGDVMLYSGNQIVFFYGVNSWSYTKIGKVEASSIEELESVLSGSETEVILSIK